MLEALREIELAKAKLAETSSVSTQSSMLLAMVNAVKDFVHEVEEGRRLIKNASNVNSELNNTKKLLQKAEETEKAELKMKMREYEDVLKKTREFASELERRKTVMRSLKGPVEELHRALQKLI